MYHCVRPGFALLGTWRCDGSGGVTCAVVGPSDAEVYEKHAAELIRFATALSGPSGAEDVVAAAVLRDLSAPRWTAIEHRRAYLFRTVFNESVRIRRATERRLRRELKAAPPEAIEVFPADRDVVAALASLSVRQRAAVYLTYWADLDAVKVSRLLGTSKRSIERDLTTSRRKLKELLA